MLKCLDLKWCAVTDVTLALLASQPLEFLDLSATDVTDDGLKYLRTMPLKHLNLTLCPKVSDDGWKLVTQYHPMLVAGKHRILCEKLLK